MADEEDIVLVSKRVRTIDGEYYIQNPLKPHYHIMSLSEAMGIPGWRKTVLKNDIPVQMIFAFPKDKVRRV